MGRAVFPPCFSTWDQTMVAVMKKMVTSFKRSHALSAAQWPWPCSRPPLTHASARNSWTLTGKSGSDLWGDLWLLWGHCSFLLGPGAPKVFFFCALQESVFPVLCKFWQLYGGVKGDLLQEGLCHTQVCCTQSLCPCGRPLLTHTFTGDTQTVKGMSGSISVGSPGEHKILFEPSEHLWCLGFDFICNFAPPTVLLGLLLCHWVWGIFFFGGIQHSPVNGCSAASCNFGVLAGEDERMSFYSTILEWYYMASAH